MSDRNKPKRQQQPKKKIIAIDEEEMEQNLRRERILGQLNRTPGKCPLGNCDQVVFPSGLLVHLLQKHSQDPRTKVSIIYDDQPFRMTFNPESFEEGVPQALAILLYAGTDGRPETRPARRHLSFANCGLLNETRRYEHHWASVLMICRTNWCTLLPDELEVNSLPENTLYIIWLVAPVTASRMYYTVTVFDRLYIQSRSVIRPTRNYAVSQDPKDFLCNASDYLMLRHEETMDLMHEAAPDDHSGPGIQLELFLHEDRSVNCSAEKPTSRHFLDTYGGTGGRMPRNKMDLNRDAKGRLSLNRKPLSIPMIATPMAFHPERGSYRPEEELKNLNRLRKDLAIKVSRERTRARQKSKYLQAGKNLERGGYEYSSDSEEDLTIDSELILSLMRDQEKLLENKLERCQEASSKVAEKDLEKSTKDLEAKFSSYMIAAEQRKATARAVFESLEKYLDSYREESSSATDLEDSLKEYAKQKTSTKQRSLERVPESPEKREVTGESLGDILLDESIKNLQIPLTKEVLETVKEAVKEAVRKVAVKTVINEIEPEPKPVINPETNPAKIPGVAINIEAVSGTDCDTYSEISQ